MATFLSRWAALNVLACPVWSIAFLLWLRGMPLAHFFPVGIFPIALYAGLTLRFVARWLGALHLPFAHRLQLERTFGLLPVAIWKDATSSASDTVRTGTLFLTGKILAFAPYETGPGLLHGSLAGRLETWPRESLHTVGRVPQGGLSALATWSALLRFYRRDGDPLDFHVHDSFQARSVFSDALAQTESRSDPGPAPQN